MPGLQDEEIRQQFGLEASAEVPEQNGEAEAVIDDNQVEQEEAQLSPVEQKAYDQGWRPEDDFNGDPDNWKTAKEFIRDGEWLAQIKSLKQDQERQKQEFDERLANSNKLHEARKAQELAALKKQQREAVSMADQDAYDDAQTQIDELEKQPQPDAPESQSKDPVIAAWEDKNPWIMDSSSEKAQITNSLFNSYLTQNQGATMQQAIDHIDSRLAVLYPTDNTNPRRNQPNSTETGGRKPRRQGRELTMGDLTQAEQQEWAMYGRSMFGDEKKFLKAVTDARKA